MAFDNQIQREILENKDFLRFTIVRNPYSRLESVWRDKVRLCAPSFEYLYFKIKGALPNGKSIDSLISFEEFLKYLSSDDLNKCNPHWRRQTSHLCNKALDFSYIGRLEKLQEAIEAFTGHAKYAEPITFERMNESVGSAHYDQSLADLVYALYEDDFLAFDYEKDSWKNDRSREESRAPETIAESKLVDEIIERNIIMGTLYATRQKLTRNLVEVSQAYTTLLSGHVQLQKAYQELRDSYERLRIGQSATG